MNDVRLRIKVNSQSLSKAAMVLSNGVVLAANLYLIGSNTHQAITSRKQAKVSQTLQTTVEVAQTLAGLTKVVTEIVSKNHVQNPTDI